MQTFVYPCRYSRSTNQPPDPGNIWNGLSAEQKLDASKSLAVYCEPVELYNKIRSRVLLLPLLILFM